MLGRAGEEGHRDQHLGSTLYCVGTLSLRLINPLPPNSHTQLLTLRRALILLRATEVVGSRSIFTLKV